MKKVLLTNDDGIYAEGLWALYHRFARENEVTVVAPDRERSAIGHAITLLEPLRIKEMTVNGGDFGYAVNGTPADCMKIALREILREKPDFVVSGINPGANIGVNINYSGTVAGAKEACLYGIPAIAASTQGASTVLFKETAGFIENLANHLMENPMPFGTFLNVNVPDLSLKDILGVKICRQGISRLAEYFEKKVDPRNQTYYWQGADTQSFEKNPDVDGRALKEKYITITPIKCDMTDHDMIPKIEEWDIQLAE